MLRRLFEERVGKAGDIEVARSRRFAVFLPDRFGCGVAEKRGQASQYFFEPLGEVHRNRPIMPSLTGCRYRCAHARDAPLAIGHRAFLFAPGRRGQQQIGVRAGGCGGEGFLHDNELGALQCAAHRGLVGHALRGVGAGDPQGLDLAISGGLEHLYRGFTGLVGHAATQLVQTPQRCDLGAVRGVGHVAVGADQIRQSTHLAPTHRVGLTCQ